MKSKIVFFLYAMILPSVVFAQEGHAAAGGNSGWLALGAGIAMGLAALGGTLGQGKAVSSGLDAIGRNPGAAGKMLIYFILGLALIESLVIVSFVIANKLVGLLG